MQPRKPNLTEPHRVQVLLAGALVSATAIRHDPERFQTLLKAAKAKFGEGVCLCQDKRLLLVIRERNDRLFLACWPDQAQSHALDCPFYGAGKESGSEKYIQGAITEDGPSTKIQLHHPMLQATPHSRGEARPQPRSAGLAKLHLWGLLHHLWEHGGLNRWNPGWKRDWGLVRYMLRRAAQSTYIDGEPLLPNLYVPPIWTDARQDDIKSHWSEFSAPLYRQHRSTSMVASGFVIGVVRKVEKNETGYTLRLKHHAEVFYIDQYVADRIASYSRKGWSVVMSSPSATATYTPPSVVAALRVQATARSKMVVVEGALMRVSPKFIPTDSSFEDRLAEVMVNQNRRFIKPLHYDIHSQKLAHFVLTDCAFADASISVARRCAMYVYGTAIQPTYQHELEQRDRQDSQQRGYEFWAWNAAQAVEVPPLPKQISSISQQTHPTSKE